MAATARALDDSGLLADVSRLAKERALDLVLVFGSVAAGKAHASSDVDVALSASAGPLAFETLVDVTMQLGGLFQAEVDGVDLRRADPLLLKKIFEHPVVLFSTPGAFEQARLHAFHRYEDYRPYLALERAAVRRRLGLDARR